MKCIVCGIEFESNRADAKYCSPKCRKAASRLSSVTDNVTLSEPDVTLNFEFYTISKANGLGRTEDEKSPIRKAKYWYDVPIAAVPVVHEDWPPMPDWMNGRQYFLWWKNDFIENQDPEKGEVGSPLILNPFPPIENIKYEMGGEGSRRWGA